MIGVDDPIPLELRANDVVSHVVNVDSEFRDVGSGSDSGSFQLSLLAPVRNILRVRLVSVEMPAGWNVWSAERGNTFVEVFYRDGAGVLMSVRLFVEDAVSYTAEGIVTGLTASIAEAGLPFGLSVTWDLSAGRFVFQSAERFGIRGGNGLSAAMGFLTGLHAAGRSGGGGSYVLRAQRCADLSGDRYLFLRVNDYAAVRQTIMMTTTVAGVAPKRHDFVALAKIWRDAAGDWLWSGGSVVFPAPMDLSRFQVQVVDRYGEIVPLCGLPVSFALEVLEVRNSSMYNMVRDGLAVSYR
jgi:hypothetical protein